MSNKTMRQFVSSSVLLLVGLVVAALSLRTSNVREIYAAGNDSVGVIDTHALTNIEMPGSLPYTTLRGWERAQLLWLSDAEKVEVYLTRIDDRCASAEMAGEAGKHDLAMTTYFKAHGYLERLRQLCVDEESICEDQSREVQTTTDRLTGSLQHYAQQVNNDSVRAKIDGLLARI